MPVLRLSAQQYSAADQSCTAALAVGPADDVGDYATVAQLAGYSYGPNVVYPFDDTGETPSLQPAAD
jgi:hypothetical protein